MSGGPEPKPPHSYVDAAVMGTGIFNWTFDPEELHAPPMVASVPHHRPPYHRQHHSPPAPPPPPSHLLRQNSHQPPTFSRHSTARHTPSFPPANLPMTPLPGPGPPPPPPPPVRVAGSSSGGGHGSGSTTRSTPVPSSGAPHGGSQNSICPHCGKKYSRPDYLSTHIAGKHSGRKMWNCKICGKSYKWRSSLSHHQKTAHQRTTSPAVAKSPHSQGHSHF